MGTVALVAIVLMSKGTQVHINAVLDAYSLLVMNANFVFAFVNSA